MFFDGLSEKDLAKIEKIGSLHKYKQGEAVLKEGEGGTSFSIVLKGKVQVRKYVADGTYKALVELSEFDLIGELGFFGATNRTASVVALEDTEMLEFSRPGFEKFTESKPEIGWKVYRNMAQILADRLTCNDETLMNTIIWALGQPRDAHPRPGADIRESPKLKVLRK